MKLYKLKEAAKKYFNFENFDINDTYILRDWSLVGISLEALEEVQTRIEVRIQIDKPRILNKVTEGMFVWTEQERKDIETFLNGDYDKIERLACWKTQ